MVITKRNLNLEIECFSDINNNIYAHPFYKSNHGHLFLSGDSSTLIDYVLMNMIRDAIRRYHKQELKIIMYSTSIDEHSFPGLKKHLKVSILKNPEELIEQIRKVKKMMINRYRSFRNNKTRDIKTFNTKVFNSEINRRYMPQVLLIIHEMPVIKDVVEAGNDLYDIVQQSRAAGIHVILSTTSAKDTMSPLLKYNMDGLITKIDSIENSKILLSKEHTPLANDIEPGSLLLCESLGNIQKFTITSAESRVLLYKNRST